MAMPLDLVEPGELGVASPRVDPRRKEHVPEGDPGPPAGARRLGAPGQFAGQGAQGEELDPPEPGANDRRGHLPPGKPVHQVVE